MCGAFQQFPTLDMAEMLAALNVQGTLENRGMCRPASKIQIVVGSENEGEHKIVDATWWLLLEKQSEKGLTWKPNQKYKTFNTRSEKLLESRLAKKPYLNTRCLIPAAGFMESKSGTYHHITNEKQSIAFGGLYKEYQLDDDEILYSASIITLPATTNFEFVHHRMPLMLDVENKNTTRQWLHKNHFPDEGFELGNNLHTPLLVTPSAKYGTVEPQGETLKVS
ncbi:MAG: hypothetical protein HKN88_02820 [Gammaproteobacteria bacterium]|nr:SOS response-associated peptidase [Gammaproteobacteria bacterium]NNC96985.1 hypothetical protein [Gammaproteobacteria bacterium]NNM13430.1 hypothetical protein [Gammaproteobacteria bacterium]